MPSPLRTWRSGCGPWGRRRPACARRAISRPLSSANERCTASSCAAPAQKPTRSGLAVVPPLRIAAAGGAVEDAAGHEQKVGEPIEVAARGIADRLAPPERYQRPFRAPAYGARKMGGRGGAAAARKDELLERGELAVPALQRGIERIHLRLAQNRVPRDAELAAEVEKIVLHLFEHRAHFRRHLLREHQADGAVQLVDIAERGDASVVLGHALAVSEAGLAGVAGARGDLGQSVAHQERFFTSLSSSP